MPPSQIVCLGLSHHTAPVELREQLSCSLVDRAQLLDRFSRHSYQHSPEQFTAVAELAILSTCNRMELYAVIEGDADPRSLLVSLLADAHGINPADFGRYLYCHSGPDAAAHLCRVAAGLDSLVLGEPQIQGQVTEAFMAAVEAHAAGPALTALFQAAIRTGKRARAETAVSSNPASLSAVAIALAGQTAGDLRRRRVLVVGLGEMGRLALKALRARGLTKIDVANRTLARAQAAVAAWNGRAYSLDQLPAALAEADVVISATGAPGPVIETTAVVEAMAASRERPLVIVDLAVPRDVAADVATLPGVRLFDVDDLRQSLDAALAARQREVPKVEAIVAEETAVLDVELQRLAVRPVIADLRQKAEAIRQRELERTLRYLGDADPEMLRHVQHLSRSLVNKLLHEPTLCLKEKALGDEADEYVASVRDLFGLELTPDA